VKALIPPLTLVDESVVRHKLDPARQMEDSSALRFVEFFSFALYIITMTAATMTAFVGYIVWQLLRDFVSVETCVPICAVSLVAQGVTWNFLFLLGERLRFCCISPECTELWFPGLNWVYRTTSDTFQQWSFLQITYGSPIFNILACLMGVTFEGRALCFGSRLYDCPLTTIGDRTVLDHAIVGGQNIVYDHATFGPSGPEGLVHEQSFVMANSILEEKKKATGPWEAVLETPDPGAATRRPTTIVSMLSRGVALDSIDDMEAPTGGEFRSSL
jgi:hypothetical protein